MSGPDLAAIAAGGVCGAALRHLLTRDGSLLADFAGTTASMRFPLPVLVVNLLGCFAIGWLARGRSRRPRVARLRRAASTGFCGSLTTLSTFAADLAQLLGAGTATASPRIATGYLIITIAGAAIAFIAGSQLAQTATGVRAAS